MIEHEIRELLHTLNQQSRRKYAERFRHLNLHVGQESALCILWNQDGITQTDLRTQMRCEASTLSNMLRKLETDAIIYREQSAEDRRSTHVFLTQKGKDLQAPVKAIWEAQQTQMLKGVQNEELLLMRQLLQHMADNILEDT